MAKFLSRRYLRKLEWVGNTEKVVGIAVLILMGGIVAAYVVQSTTNQDYLFIVDQAGPEGQAGPRETAPDGRTSPTPENAAGQAGMDATQSEAASPFPDPGVDQWQSPQKVSRFNPDNLYEKINGRAGLYLQYHVSSLVFGTYGHLTDGDRTIDVYWYDLAQPENAFGIYRAEAPPDAPPVSIGQAGYQVGGAVFFLKGSSYVQVLPASFDAADGQVALKIAERIGEQIADQGDEMWALAVLPENGRLADSFEYLAKDSFGLDFLSDVYAAAYDVDGGRVKLFIHRAADQASARALLEEYRAYFEEYGETIWADSDDDPRIVAGRAFGVIDVVFAKGIYLGGVAGAEDLEAARKTAVAFYEGLTAP